MSPARTLLSDSILVAGCALLITGCGKEPVPAAPAKSPAAVKQEETADSKLARGERLMSIRRADEANRLAAEVLVGDPDNARAIRLAGQAAVAMGDVDGGVEMLDRAAELLPDQWPVLYAEGTGLLWENNRFDEAQQRFITLLRKHPDYDDARRGLATLLNLRGFRFDANQQIRFLSRRPRFQATIDELRGLMVPSRSYHPFESKPPTDDREWIKSTGELNVARALYGEGDVRDALSVLQQSDVLRQGHPAALALYGRIVLESQQFELFDQWLRDVVASPQRRAQCERYPAYWLAMGGWALRQQEPRQAMRLIAEALVREPGEVPAHDRMLQALEAAGETEAAQRFEQRRIQVQGLVKLTGLLVESPEIPPDAYMELAGILEQVGRPFEAKNWRSLARMRMGQGADAMRQADMELADLLVSENPAEARATLLCGLDLSNYEIDIAKLLPEAGTTPNAIRASVAAVPEALPPVFVNVAQEVGIDHSYANADPPKDRYFLMHEAVGAGVACFDYDRDGKIDLYVGQGACNAPLGVGTLPNLLARNVGDRFETVTIPSQSDDRGYTLGITAGDWNQDGFPDLVVASMTTNVLFINQGDGTFRRQAGDALWDDGKYTASVAIADVSGDHLPDIVEITYLDDDAIYTPLEFGDEGRPVRFPGPLHFQACLDRVFTGQGDGTMAGEYLQTDSPSPGLGVLVADIDGRGGNEIFVANDMKANHLWRHVDSEAKTSNQFVDSAVARGVAYGPSGTPLACMGIAAADFDENGFLDLHITNFADQWTNQYMQNEEGLFDDLTLPFGLDGSTHKMLGFGTQPIDYDNNSTIDLITGNGHIDDLTHEGTPFEMPTQLFVGDRKTLKETEVGGDPNYWSSNHLTRAVATLDWNRDGRIDVVTTDLKEPVALLENRTDSGNHWIDLRLVGKNCERDAIGAVVVLKLANDREVTRHVQTGDGYMAKNQSDLHIGLGDVEQIASIEIRWPDASVQSIQDIKVDSLWLLVQNEPPFQLP